MATELLAGLVGAPLRARSPCADAEEPALQATRRREPVGASSKQRAAQVRHSEEGGGEPEPGNCLTRCSFSSAPRPRSAAFQRSPRMQPGRRRWRSMPCRGDAPRRSGLRGPRPAEEGKGEWEEEGEGEEREEEEARWRRRRRSPGKRCAPSTRPPALRGGKIATTGSASDGPRRPCSSEKRNACQVKQVADLSLSFYLSHMLLGRLSPRRCSRRASAGSRGRRSRCCHAIEQASQVFIPLRRTVRRQERIFKYPVH